MAATDGKQGRRRVLTQTGHAASVTPSDATDLTAVTSALYVGGTGDVTVNTVGGETAVLFKAVPVGTVLPIRVTRVKSTGTTATNLVALW